MKEENMENELADYYHKGPDHSGTTFQKGVILSNDTAQGWTFTNATMPNSRITNASVLFCDFTGANLSGSDMSNTDFRGSIFTNANLTNTNLDGSDLRGTNLTGANMRGASTNGTNFGKLQHAENNDEPIKQKPEPNINCQNENTTKNGVTDHFETISEQITTNSNENN